MIPIEDALELIEQNVEQLHFELQPIHDCVGQVLSSPAISDIDSPPYSKSMMDGFAIRFSDFQNGTREFNIVERVLAGQQPTKPLGPNQATQIMTGAPIPEGCEAVVMVLSLIHI